MSWSLFLIGTPDKIIAAMKKQSEEMTDGKSKEEFDKALPALTTLVEANHNKQSEPVLKLNASGSEWSSTDGTQGQGNCIVSLENLGTVLV